MKRSYSTDLSDAQWRRIEPHLPPPNERGRPKSHTTPEILDAIFYLPKSGCTSWGLLPRDLERALGERLLVVREVACGRHLRTAQRRALGELLRSRLGRDPLPSAGIADSRSSKSTGVGGEQRGYAMASRRS